MCFFVACILEGIHMFSCVSRVLLPDLYGYRICSAVMGLRAPESFHTHCKWKNLGDRSEETTSWSLVQELC